jgi:ribosomal protein RSM22 (predicted rRNA methylase)
MSNTVGSGPADMLDTAPHAFPDPPDEAVVALHRFLEDVSTAVENHYFAQLHCWHHPPPDDDQLPLPLDPPF